MFQLKSWLNQKHKQGNKLAKSFKRERGKFDDDAEDYFEEDIRSYRKADKNSRTIRHKKEMEFDANTSVIETDEYSVKLKDY